MPKASTILLVLGALALALFGWAFWKSRQPGSTGGVWGTIMGLWGGASGLVQSATEATTETFGTWGSFLESGARGTGGLVSSASSGASDIADEWTHKGGWTNPLNWF